MVVHNHHQNKVGYGLDVNCIGNAIAVVVDIVAHVADSKVNRIP